MIQKKHFIPNGDGWLLGLKQTYEPRALERSRRPVAIIPGYGMNAFIFGYHPRGNSMEAYWADKGFEVWSLNLRAQGNSKRVGGKRQYGFYEAAVTDLGTAFDHIARNTETKAAQIDAVGCSLGGTYLYVNLAFSQEKNLLGSVVTIGAPLRWVKVNPMLKTAFGSPRVAGMLAIRGVRPFARLTMPVLTRIPKLLHVYLHPEIVDTSKMNEMIETVENPNRMLNREIAEWVKQGDLVVRGVNVTEGIEEVNNPLLVVLSNADGIVPEATALSAYEKMGASFKEVLRVGTKKVPVAHADLFVSDIAQQWVFEPLAQWLIARNQAPSRKRSAGGGARKRDDS
jgi:pimeloyl-ACP methyl ester carboxylesterase